MEMISRFQRLERKRQKLLIDAVVALGGSSAALVFLPFRRAIRVGSVPLQRRDHGVSAEDCAWAVEAAARRIPWRTVCIQRGLATQKLLRRAGIDARLHYGARHQPVSGKLEAHVWVTVDSETVCGGAESANFAEVAAYP